MPNNKKGEKELAYRRRVEYEDSLLNTRTRIVLTLNGLAAVAVGLSLTSTMKFIIAIVIIIIDILWLICALDAMNYISRLTEELRNSENPPFAEEFRWRVQAGRFRIGSTSFVCFIIPALLLFAWLVGLSIKIIITLCSITNEHSLFKISDCLK